MSIVYLSLGSNIEPRKNYLKRALKELASLEKTQLTAVSSLYETPAWGLTNQADFLNLACQLETELSPQDLLFACQRIEIQLNRVRHEHWGPRTLDIDMLLYDELALNEPNLTIPHPYLHQRAFVLVPLLEINPKLSSPKTSQAYQKDLVKLAQDIKTIKKIGQIVIDD